MKNKLIAFCILAVLFISICATAVFAEKAVNGVVDIVTGAVGVVVGAVEAAYGTVSWIWDGGQALDNGLEDMREGFGNIIEGVYQVFGGEPERPEQGIFAVTNNPTTLSCSLGGGEYIDWSCCWHSKKKDQGNCTLTVNISSIDAQPTWSIDCPGKIDYKNVCNNWHQTGILTYYNMGLLAACEAGDAWRDSANHLGGYVRVNQTGTTMKLELSIITCQDGKYSECSEYQDWGENRRYAQHSCSFDLRSLEADKNEYLCKEKGGNWLLNKTGIALEKEQYEAIDFANFCCGDDESYDIGTFARGILAGGPIDNNYIDNHFICVKDFDGQWKWVDASEGKGFFIKEINLPYFPYARISYDSVSNAEQWFNCNYFGIGPVPIVEFFHFTDQIYEEKFARFYCYKSGVDYRYSICNADSEIEQKNSEYKSSALRGTGSVTTTIFESVNPISIKDNLSTGGFYIPLFPNERPIRDWREYKSLDFFIKINDTRIPLYLQIFSPYENEYILFDEPILDYAVNTPAPNKWVHVSVPVGDWINVRNIRLYQKSTTGYTTPEYTAELQKVFLIPENKTNLAFCSDKALKEEEGIYSSWVSDLDNNSAACNANKAFGWTGTRCCGDDFEEYYNDTEKGCWNSNVIINDSTTTNVRYNITKIPVDRYNQTYPNQSFNFSINNGRDNYDVRERTIMANLTAKITIPNEIKRDFAQYNLTPPDNNKVNLFFFDTGTLTTYNPNTLIYATTDYSESEPISQIQTTKLVKYNCNSNTCIYPLPAGKSGENITVENLHPDKYNLYIVEFKTGNKILANPTATTNEDSYILVENVKQNIIFYNGSFYGCKAPEYILSGLSGLVDNSADYCTVKGTYFCSYNDEWSNKTEGAPNSSSRNTPKQIPSGVNLENVFEFGCCPVDYCWNGTACIADMSAKPTDTLDINGILYRCIAGNWVKAITRYTWDNSESGFCATETQCLVDIDGNASFNNNVSAYFGPDWSQNPQCIETGQFIEDNYCDNGNWTSRTKLLAMQLLNITGETNSFTLYCDYYNKVLPSYGDTSIRDTLIEGREVDAGLTGPIYSCFDGNKNTGEYKDNHYYNKPCANNFCSLTYVTGGNPNIVLATSVNRPVGFSLNIPPISFFLEEVFGVNKTYCNNLIGKGEDFKKCNNDDKFWYSDKINLIITSYPQGIDLEPQTTWDRITSFFRDIFEFLFGWQPVNRIGTVINLSFVNQTADFNKICISKQGEKETYVIMEEPEPSKKFLTARYVNLAGTDVCRIVYTLGLTEIELDCNQTGSNYTVYAEASITTEGSIPDQQINSLWSTLADTCIRLS